MKKINIGSATGSVVVNGSVRDSNISMCDKKSNSDIFVELKEALANIEDDETRKFLIEKADRMAETAGTSDFTTHYRDFMSGAADHLTVLGPFMSGLMSCLL